MTAGGPGGPGGETAEEVSVQILRAAANVFATQGPDSVTVKWISLESGVPADDITERWPDVLTILGAVLDDIAYQFEALALLPATDDNALTRVELTDRYQRIVARALLDGVNPASLQSEFPVIEHLVSRGISERDVDERSARYRISQIYALEWGWRLFGPHLLAACGLADEPVDAGSRELLALQDAISWLGPVAPLVAEDPPPAASGTSGSAGPTADPDGPVAPVGAD